MPMPPDQIEDLLALHTDLLAALFARLLAAGQMTPQEFRVLVDDAVLRHPHADPGMTLAPLYLLAQETGD